MARRTTSENHSPPFLAERSFSYIIEIALGVVAPDVKQGQLTGVLARNTLKPLNPLELALEGPVVLEGMTPYNLGRAPRARGRAAGQPDFAIGAAADPAEQLVIWDEWKNQPRQFLLKARAPTSHSPARPCRLSPPLRSRR